MEMRKEIEEVTRIFTQIVFGVGVTLREGNIQFDDAEVIACAVDNSLNLGASGSAALSLLSAGGNSLQNECKERFPSGIKYGDVIVLDGGNLKCKKIFLTSMADCEVEDEEHENEDKESEDEEHNFKKSKVLQNTLSAILDNAVREKVKSIAIPAIGIGKMGLTAKAVASNYFDCVKKRKSDFGSLRHIAFILYCNSVFKEFETHLFKMQDGIGNTFLHYTVLLGSVDCLERITDIVIPDKDKQYREQYMLKCLNNDGITILQIACREGKTEMCQFIVDNYPSLVDIRDNIGWHILHNTAHSGSVDCLERITDILIPDKDKKHREQYMLKCLNNDGSTILHAACLKGKTEMCQFIVNNYPSLVNIRDNNGWHILHNTAHSGSVDCLERITDILIPDKDKKHREQYMLKCLNNDGSTILHAAGLGGQTEMCHFIVNNYPSLVNIRNNNGRHILNHTALSGCVDCLERITDIVLPGMDRQHRERFMLKCLTNNGSTILHAACHKGKTEMCQFIVDNYPSLVNIRNNNEFHILHHTAQSGSVACLERITDIVIPDKNKQHREQYMLKCLNNYGSTILHAACLKGKTEMCQFIVNNYPGLVDIRNNNEFHILHHAAQSGSVDCLERITDIVIPDKDKQHREQYMLECLTNNGSTILNVACLRGKTEMCQFIGNNYPSLVNIRANNGRHILYHTAQSGSVDCLERITDIVIPEKDKQHREQYMLECLTTHGSTILHAACLKGKTEMCQFIVDNYPGLVDIRDNNGWHILHDTAQSGSVDCLERITDIVIPDKDKQHREQYMIRCITREGFTILDIAIDEKKKDMRQYIANNYPKLVKRKKKCILS